MKFNTPTSGSTRTVNHEGGTAYSMPADLELYSAVVTTFLEDKFYESSDERMKRIRALTKKVAQDDPLFVAQLAVYARQVMNMRSAPILLTCLLTESHNGDDLVRRATRKVISRADEITEMLACYSSLYSTKGSKKKLGKLSKQLQKGIADVFGKFTEYQFAKYNRDGDVKLRDAMFLTHPKGNDELFAKIAKDELKVADTWETRISAAGQKKENVPEEKKKEWTDLIVTKKIGYMALLRNLRNILESGVDADTIEYALVRLADPDEVRTSKQFPFRFLSAYREIERMGHPLASHVMSALDKALLASVDNLPFFSSSENIAIGCDVSGSMETPVSDKSVMKLKDVGLVLAALLREKCKAVTPVLFATSAAIVNTPAGSPMNSVSIMGSKSLGGSTNGFLVPIALQQLGIKYDKVFIFTDCEMYDDHAMWSGGVADRDFRKQWANYKNMCPDAKLYIFNLAGYDTTPISVRDKDVYCISGWSERMFGILESLDRGSSVLDEIRKVEL